MIKDEADLIAELLQITAELDGKMERLSTYDSNGRTSKKIVIEYEVLQSPREHISYE
jgi:hypothetical protein